MTSSTMLSILSYSLCSGTMLILNKAVTAVLPSAFLASVQFAFAVVAILAMKCCGFLTLDVREALTNPNIYVPYAKYCVLFLLGVFSNMQSLSTSSVDTVIVFRSSTPLLVCFMDMTFMGRQSPSRRSIFSMCAMALGALLYVQQDSQFQMIGFSAYFWVLCYYFIISVEMIFGKKITRDVKCSLATSVFLTNLFTLPAMLTLSHSLGESWSVDILWENFSYAVVLFLSCVAGTGIGFAGWWCRSLISATSFTVVGIVNKVLTVILNIVVWDKHATPIGTFYLLVCLGGGVAYQQAPLRESATTVEEEGVPMLSRRKNESSSKSNDSNGQGVALENGTVK